MTATPKMRDTFPMRTILACVAMIVLLAGCGGGAKADSQPSHTPTPTVTVTKTAAPKQTASPADRAYYREVTRNLMAGNTRAEDTQLAKAICAWAPTTTRDALIHKLQQGTTQGSLEPSSFGLVIDAAVAAYCPQYSDDIAAR